MNDIRLLNKVSTINATTNEQEVQITIAINEELLQTMHTYDDLAFIGKLIMRFFTERFLNKKIPALFS